MLPRVTVDHDTKVKLVTAGGREVEVFDAAGNRVGVLTVDDPEPTLEELVARSEGAVWVSTEELMARLRGLTKCE